MKSTIGVFIWHYEGFEYHRLLTEELMVLVELLHSAKQYMQIPAMQSLCVDWELCLMGEQIRFIFNLHLTTYLY